MSEQNLDDADIDLLLEQVRGKGVAQRVHRDPLVDARVQGCAVHRAVELPGAQRLDGIGLNPLLWTDSFLNCQRFAGQQPPLVVDG